MSPSKAFTFLNVVAFSLFVSVQVAAQETGEELKFSPTQIDFFENNVRPLLVNHCLACHGDDENRIRGGLHLTSRESILEGGDSGPAMVPGEPDESLLIQSVRYEDFEMPPAGQLDEGQIEVLARWIEMGAPDPRTGHHTEVAPPIDIEAGKMFWAFTARKPVDVPETRDAIWPRSDIDRFILESLEAADISPVDDADRETLVRRAYITLIGLPPTVEQIDEFVIDSDEIDVAFARVVDQLLDSRHFGERWGRHWMDVARFAESSGGGRSLMFPNAWRFRDYVIDSYNADKPFDRFIKEQIAGDLLPFDSHDQKIEQIVATGMLALGPTNYEQQDKELLRMEVIDEQVDTIGRAFMGLTLGCARCHDHKFDPIPMTDYYALAGIFGGTQSLVDGNVSKYVEQPLATESELEIERAYRQQVAALSKELAAAEEQLRQLGGGVAESHKGKGVSSQNLDGVVVDDVNATLTGQWTESTHTARFVDGHYLHDEDKDKGDKSAVFTPQLQTGGRYEVRLSYSAGGNRASNVPVTIDHQDGKSTVRVNQSREPPIDGTFVSLGTYRFEANNKSTITVSTNDTDGHVIVDAVQLLIQDEAVGNQPDEPTGSSPKLATVSPGKETETSETDQPSVEIRNATLLVNSLDAQLKELKKHAPGPVAVAMSVKDLAQPADGPLYIRGSVRNPGPIVQRGFVSVCCDDDPKPDLASHESGRLQLARWLARPDHPLTARVYVNRVWRHLFGSGIVPTTDNFGLMGGRPSHPQLLDYLAEEFVNDGWSTKKLIRKIMLSRVYRLGSIDDPEAIATDDSNRLLWRFNRRRVDAEVLRDSILFISGELDLTPGGLTIRKITEYDLGYEFDSVRRSVYVPAFRNSMLDVFEVFDFANPNLVTGHRNTSTLPTQALYLMNSPMVIEQSRHAAMRMLGRNGLTEAERIDLAFRQVLGRRPSVNEVQATSEFLGSFAPASKNDQPGVESWSSFFHALFASLDFRYVD